MLAAPMGARARVRCMADRRPSHPHEQQSYEVYCDTEGCVNDGYVWTIWPVRHTEGLLIVPTLVCAECKMQVVGKVK